MEEAFWHSVTVRKKILIFIYLSVFQHIGAANRFFLFWWTGRHFMGKGERGRIF